MNLLFFTAMTTAAVAALPGFSRHTPIVIDSTETCQFHLGSKPYDLCPILGGAAVKFPMLVKGGKTEYRFYFGLDGGILADDLVISHNFCSFNKSDMPSESLTLRFGGAVERTAEIRLICDSNQLTEPVFSRVENHVHYFVWQTRYACETGRQVSGSRVNALEVESDAPPADDTSDPSGPDEGEDQLLDGDRERKLRRSTAIIFAPILHRLSPDNLPRFSLPHSLKPAGESRLVRWAQEDLELDEDIMVNGSDTYYEPEDAGDESIPLRPSPHKGGRFVKNYGSATSPFW
ncbi:hypothetical protein B0H14DRAFT_2889916 [Mycena olivaceomarginata]|nr:hypothetical protein B0H14DRAFT_2889916 [Mycena olivaceomarginata]